MLFRRPIGRPSFAVLLLLAAAALPAGAQTVLLDQPALSQVGLMVAPPVQHSDSACGTGGTGAAIAEDFVLTAAAEVTEATWTGNYSALHAPADPTPFTLIFHQDAAGLPGAAIVTHNVLPTQLELASGTISPGNIPFSLHRYTASFPAVALTPGAYWLEIVETESSTTECFRWSLGDLDPARGRPGNAASLTAPGAAWIPNTNGSPQDRVLTLIAGGSVTEVPTLGEWGLLALATALAGAGVARVRRA